MIERVTAVHFGWGQAPSLDTNMTYESTIWVPLNTYCEYGGLLGASPGRFGCLMGRQ